jgi:hypothetical protein
MEKKKKGAINGQHSSIHTAKPNQPGKVLGFRVYAEKATPHPGYTMVEY